MGRENSLTSSRRRWNNVVMQVGVMVMMVMSSAVNSEDQMGVPDSGLLCISDCATCPVICSPPSSPSVQSPPPPAHYSPPHPLPPPPPVTYYYSSPPPPSSPSPKPHPPPPQAPSWYPYWGIPPPPGSFYNPPIVQVPPTQGQGQHPYPYPYYYFYASKASSLHLCDAFLFFPLVFLHVLYFWF